MCFDALVHRCAELDRSVSVALGPKEQTAEEKCREAEDHKAPDHEHHPIHITGLLNARAALAFGLDGASLRILRHPMRVREQRRRDLLAVVPMEGDHTLQSFGS